MSVAQGGIFFSKKAHNLYMKAHGSGGDDALTPRQMDVISLCAAEK
jgi:DNA-binding NarL/FixJ family response regulator